MNAIMNKKTLIALNKSIDHWFENLQILILNYLSNFDLNLDIDISAESCPLCKLFNNDYNHSCEKCPISNNGINRFCHGTPYSDVDRWLNDVDKFFPLSAKPQLSNITPMSLDSLTRLNLYKTGTKLISNQIDFLISLKGLK